MAKPYEVTRVAIARAVHHRVDPAKIQALRVQLAEEVLEGRIARLVAAAPPLTAEQQDRLRALLTSAGESAMPESQAS